MTHDDDDLLAAELGEALATSRDVPPEWREAARAAFAWRTIDAELLALVHDSALETGVAVRGVAGPRVLSFAGGDLSLEVELTDRQVMGQLTSPGPGLGEVTFESADGRQRSTPTDDSGFFVLDGEDHGLVRFSVRAEGASFVTEWFVL